MISGLHPGPYHEQPVEFVDHREYVPGDDPRPIDWKLPGRGDRTVIKRYEEDTNLRGPLLLDVSESICSGADVGTRAGMSKYDYTATIADNMAYLLRRQRNAVASEHEPRDAPPRGRSHGEGKAGVQDRSRSGSASARRGDPATPSRGLVLAPIEAIEEGRRHFVVCRHGLVVFHVLDEKERSFPFEASPLIRGLEETPEVMVERRSPPETEGLFLRTHLRDHPEHLREAVADMKVAEQADPHGSRGTRAGFIRQQRDR